MNNFEFLSYKQYSRDQSDPKLKYNPHASATVRIDRRFVITMVFQSFGEAEPFWQEVAMGVGEVGKEKKTYLKGCLLDSQYEKDQLVQFIKENVEKYKANSSAITQAVASIAQTGGGVAFDEPVPF